MRDAYFGLVFSYAADKFQDAIGIDAAYRESTGCTLYLVEDHKFFLAELKENQPIKVEMRLLNYDEKRLHLMHQMFKADGELAATNELMILHVNLNTRKACAFPKNILSEITSIALIDAPKPKPKQIGQTIAIPRR